MSAIVDPAFKAIPKGCTAFLVWRIENMQVVPVPRSQYGNFYDGDSYIVYAASEYGRPCGVDTKSTEVRGSSIEIHIHFWLGNETSTDEAGVAAFKTVELDDYLGGNPIQHREAQGTESARFKGYFKNGFTVLKGGAASGFNHVTDQFEPRLFHVKGRRCPTITQQPAIKWEYLNSGDVFILDTKEVVFIWIGKTANKMEKLQASKVASKLRDEHGASSIVFVDEGQEQNLPACEKRIFNSFLKLNERTIKSADEAGEDEVVEEVIRGSLTLYHCTDDDGTYKVTELKSGPLQQSDLNSDDSFIIDNGAAGSWVWIGRRASPKERVEAVRNAHGFITKKGYPPTTPITRVIDGGEPTEFKMLFTSWKERNQTVGLGKQNSSSRIAVTVHTKLDAATLHETPKLAAKSQLVDDGTGERTVWRVNQFELEEVPEKEHGIFFSGDSYVILYSYSSGGTDKYIIYYWLGKHSPSDEQGTAALKAVEKDDELGGAPVQVRVVQGKEPAHFLAMFKGRMLIFNGGHASAFEGEEAKSSSIPDTFLLHVRGNANHNTRATQVDLRAASLNSNDVFVLKGAKTCFVWCGKGATGDEREMAKQIAEVASHGDYALVYEGQEKADFWEEIGGKEDYANDIQLTEASDELPARLFQLSNASGTFKAEEIVNFEQSDLVEEDVMLLDTREALYLWLGKDSRQDERKMAVETAIEYLRTDPTNRDQDTPILQIKQGYEPPTFTGFFGVWDTSLWNNNKSFEEVRREMEDQNPVLQIDVSSAGGNQSFNDFPKYSLEVLRNIDPSKLPDDVDVLHKELHLSKEDFSKHFRMEYGQFSELPAWKQNNLKKEVGIF
ncbi:villin-1 [Anabrus simplex]|uniref:villin-1 n=1 Tax=Anabrus simplex TaxID=316456 RepID=UPI0035A307B7